MKTTQASELRKIIACVISVSVITAAAAMPVQAKGETHFNNDLSVTVNSITGDGKAASSLSDGTHMLDIFNTNSRGKTDTGYDYSFSMGAKATDDKRNDVKNLSLTNIQGRWSKNENTFVVGDVMESYSQYSLNSALKGFSYRYDKPDAATQSVGVIFGVACPRWDNFYGGTDTKTILRQAYGGTVRRSFGEGWTGGFSAVRVNDDARVSAADSLFSGGVYAFDANYQPFAGLEVKSELAFSSVNESLGGGGDNGFGGQAFKAEAIGSGGPSRVSLEYERVAPKFLTPLGAATPDREKVKTKWRYKLSKDKTLNCGILWYRNNLDDSIAAGGISATRPEAGINIRNIFARNTATGDFTYRMFLQHGQGQSSKDHVFNANYRDRFGTIDNDSNLGYSIYQTDTDVRKSKEINFNTSLSTQRTKGDVVYRPGVNLGMWNVTDELISKTNKVTEYSVGAAIEVPKKNIVSNIKIGQSKLDNEVNDDSDRLFVNGSVFFKPAALAKYNNPTVYVKAMYNTYNYSTSANNFKETSITAGLNIQY